MFDKVGADWNVLWTHAYFIFSEAKKEESWEVWGKGESELKQSRGNVPMLNLGQFFPDSLFCLKLSKQSTRGFLELQLCETTSGEENRPG